MEFQLEFSQAHLRGKNQIEIQFQMALKILYYFKKITVDFQQNKEIFLNIYFFKEVDIDFNLTTPKKFSPFNLNLYDYKFVSQDIYFFVFIQVQQKRKISSSLQFFQSVIEVFSKRRSKKSSLLFVVSTKKK